MGIGLGVTSGLEQLRPDQYPSHTAGSELRPDHKRIGHIEQVCFTTKKEVLRHLAEAPSHSGLSFL